MMKDYENVVAELKQQLQESELQRQHQVKVGLGPQNQSAHFLYSSLKRPAPESGPGLGFVFSGPGDEVQTREGGTADEL